MKCYACRTGQCKPGEVYCPACLKGLPSRDITERELLTRKTLAQRVGYVRPA